MKRVKLLHAISIAALLLMLSACNALVKPESSPLTAATDNRDYRYFELTNKMKVLLVFFNICLQIRRFGPLLHVLYSFRV